MSHKHEQLLQAERARRAERDPGTGPMQHDQPRGRLRGVGKRLQRNRHEQPGRLRALEKVDERAFLGDVRGCDDDGSEGGHAEQPGQPVVGPTFAHGGVRARTRSGRHGAPCCAGAGRHRHPDDPQASDEPYV